MATDPEDYLNSGTQSVSFAPGQTQATYLITIVDDNIREQSETIQPTLLSGTQTRVGEIGSASVTILDDDSKESYNHDFEDSTVECIHVTADFIRCTTVISRRSSMHVHLLLSKVFTFLFCTALIVTIFKFITIIAVTVLWSPMSYVTIEDGSLLMSLTKEGETTYDATVSLAIYPVTGTGMLIVIRCLLILNFSNM